MLFLLFLLLALVKFAKYRIETLPYLIKLLLKVFDQVIEIYLRADWLNRLCLWIWLLALHFFFVNLDISNDFFLQIDQPSAQVISQSVLQLAYFTSHSLNSLVQLLIPLLCLAMHIHEITMLGIGTLVYPEIQLGKKHAIFTGLSLKFILECSKDTIEIFIQLLHLPILLKNNLVDILEQSCQLLRVYGHLEEAVRDYGRH